MSYHLEAAIHLSIPDNTAFTVLVALRRLGYTDLERVDRTELLRLDLSDAAEAQDVIEHLARAEVIFNPNKHRLSYSVLHPAVGERSSVVRERSSLPSSTEGRADEYEAVVADRDEDTRRLTALLANHFGILHLESLRRAVAWRLYDACGPAAPQRLQWACDQLLCNPHSQTVEIRRVPERIAFREQDAPTANVQR